MKNKKPYKYNSKSRLTNTNSFPFKINNNKIDPKKSLENTLTRLKIIEEVPQNEESLDDGFLEGRVESKEDKKKKKKKNGFLHKKEEAPKKVEKPILNKVDEQLEEDIKEEPQIIKVEDVPEKKELKPKKKPEKRINPEKIAFFRKLFLSVSAICAVILVLMLLSDAISEFTRMIAATKDRVPSNYQVSEKVDANYLFVGGYHTSRFSFSDYKLDYHYVNGGNRDLTTGQLLGEMKERIYDYNPSILFLELGSVDLNKGVSKEEILANYTKIIKAIQLNRPYANIYIESVYPINPNVDSYVRNEILEEAASNQEITDLNVSLRQLAKENNVAYLDFDSVLSQKGVLNPKYTDNGVYLNSDGYNAVLKKIKSIIG